jgi:hypothetical protein
MSEVLKLILTLAIPEAFRLIREKMKQKKERKKAGKK